MGTLKALREQYDAPQQLIQEIAPAPTPEPVEILQEQPPVSVAEVLQEAPVEQVAVAPNPFAPQ